MDNVTLGLDPNPVCAAILDSDSKFNVFGSTTLANSKGLIGNKPV